MADYSIFLFWSFLFCYYPLFISTLFCDSAKKAEQIEPLPVYKENSCNASPLPRRPFLPPVSNCFGTVPCDVLSDLKRRCPAELPEFLSNHSQQAMASNCTCELIGSSGIPANSTACAEMLKSCASSTVPLWVGILLVLLLAVCAAGCFWCWKHRDAARLDFPRFLQRSGSRRDYSKTLSPRPRAFGSKRKAPGGAQGRRPAATEADPCDDYENLEVGPPKAEGPDGGLYENTLPARSAEHVYGNETASAYYNFQESVSPTTPQDEDIYILPD